MISLLTSIPSPSTFGELPHGVGEKFECPRDELEYLSKEEDVMATDAELPNGLNEVFVNGFVSRGVDGQKTYSAACISYIGGLPDYLASEENVKKVILRGGIGWLHVDNHRIVSLTLRPDMLKNLKGVGVEEIMLLVGKQCFAFDQPVPIRFPKSYQQYETICSETIPRLKQMGVIPSSDLTSEVNARDLNSLSNGSSTDSSLSDDSPKRENPVQSKIDPSKHHSPPLKQGGCSVLSGCTLQ